MKLTVDKMNRKLAKMDYSHLNNSLKKMEKEIDKEHEKRLKEYYEFKKSICATIVYNITGIEIGDTVKFLGWKKGKRALMFGEVTDYHHKNFQHIWIKELNNKKERYTIHLNELRELRKKWSFKKAINKKRKNKMGAERVDYSSDDEYQQAVQQEIWDEQQRQEEQQMQDMLNECASEVYKIVEKYGYDMVEYVLPVYKQGKNKKFSFKEAVKKVKIKKLQEK